MHEGARRAAAEFGEKIVFRTVRTNDRAALRRCGEPSALYIDDRKVRTGPPPSYEKIRNRIARRVGRLERRRWLRLPC